MSTTNEATVVTRNPRLLITAVATAMLAGATAGSWAQNATTAVYDDWTLRCVAAAPASPQKTCEIEQLTQAEGKTVSRIAIEQPAKGQAARLVVQVPVNVTIANGVKIRTNEKDPVLEGPFTRCGPRGCFATIALNVDAMPD